MSTTATKNAMAPEQEQALLTLENLRHSVERNYRESQETGEIGKANLARQRFLVRMRSIKSQQPDAYKVWLAGNARFLRAVEEGRNPVIC